jgi:hypothetical protein
MKKTILMLILITCSLPFSLVIGQNLKNPSWINGSWQNTMNSNLRTSFVWTFDHDSIFVECLMPGSRKKNCISGDYLGYKQTRFSVDSLYRVTFSRVNDTVVYEFKLANDRTMDKPALTYSLTINGIKKVGYSKGADSKYFKN